MTKFLIVLGCMIGGERCNAQSKPPGPLQFPTLFPPWKPEWRLLRSTIAMPCNYSGWFNATLGAEFGIVSFDWANHENSYRSRALPGFPGGPVFPDNIDLVEQARMVKAINNETHVFVYRQGQGIGINFGEQDFELLNSPEYDGFCLKTVNNTPMPGTINNTDGRRIACTFDFRNSTLVDYFSSQYVGGELAVGNELVSGWYADDVGGLGSPGSPDKTKVVQESGLTPEQVELWNKGQQKAVVAAQNLAVNKLNAFNWQNFQPMCEAGHDEPCSTGAVGMVAIDKDSCVNGGPDLHGGKGFAGLRKICSSSGGNWTRDIPWLYLLWHDRDSEIGRFPGQGSCSEAADCALDTCKEDGGGVECAPIVDIRQRIASFLLSRGDYAWMGYSWMGCAGCDHKRKYFPFPDGPYQCPQNKTERCSGYVDQARWQAPRDWDPEGAMLLDYGEPRDQICTEISDGVFQRKFDKITVQLDCNTWSPKFIQNDPY